MSKTLRYTTKTFAGSFTFNNTNDDGAKTVLSHAGYDRRIYGILAISTSEYVSGENFSLYLNRINDPSDVDDYDSFLVSTGNIPPFAGTNGTTAAVDVMFETDLRKLLKQKDADGNYFFHLPANHSLKIEITSNLNDADDMVSFMFWGEEYENRTVAGDY